MQNYDLINDANNFRVRFATTGASNNASMDSSIRADQKINQTKIDVTCNVTSNKLCKISEGRVLRRRDNKQMKNRRTKFKKHLSKSALIHHDINNSVFSNYVDDDKLFMCPICRNLLTSPVTVECGHSFCSNCLNVASNSTKCNICYLDISLILSVDVLIQNLSKKWRDLKKMNGNSVINNFGIEPRYHLRSGFAGLQLNEKAKTNIIDFNLLKFCNTKQKTTFISNLLKELEVFKSEATYFDWEHITLADFECILCSRCLLDPVTTACGHTFCRGCLTRVLDHGLSCPLCMALLTVKDYSRGSNVVLTRAIRDLFPKEHYERVYASIKELRVNHSNIPVFICTNAFPGIACPLYVYEPRYRLLVRRCLQSPSRKFAMAAKANPDREKFVSYGTVLEVKDALFLEDGSFILTTIGINRFKVVARAEEDGYDTAKIYIVKDTPVPNDKLPDLLALHQKVYSKAMKWIQSLTTRVLDEVERLIGQMPKVEKNWPTLSDGPLWTWWLMPILPLSPQLQVGFLSTTSLEKRLRAIDIMLERMEMRALENDTGNIHIKDSSETCTESERNCEIPFSD